MARAPRMVSQRLATQGTCQVFTALFKLVRRRHLDVTLATAKGIETRIIERPGEWMAPQDLADLTEDLRSVARRTLTHGALTYGVFSGTGEALENAVVTIVYARDSGRPIAFNALSIMDVSLAGRRERVLHLGLVMIDPEARGQGLSWVLYGLTCFLIFMRNQLRPFWISSVTQVPAVVGMVEETFSAVFPGPSAPARPALAQVLLARQIMGHHRSVFGVGGEAGFDEDRFIITDAYTGGSDDLKKSFDETTKHRDQRYSDYCQGLLDYDRGDDILQLGLMDMAAARRYLFDRVPGSAVLQLTATGFWIALQRLALPVVHWADAGRAWNQLRPWKERASGPRDPAR